MESLAVKMMEKATESDRLWSMLEHVFVDLAETCIMGNRQGKTTSSNPPIDVIALGMGDDSIWHGYLDALVDVVPLRISSSDDSDDDYSSESSSGGKSIPEAKVRLVDKVLHQIIGEAVVMSFIHRKRHPQHMVLAPSVAIAATGEFSAALYDSNKDFLFTLPPRLCWLDITSKSYQKSGLVVLWVLLHHKLFFNQSKYNKIPDRYC